MRHVGTWHLDGKKYERIIDLIEIGFSDSEPYNLPGLESYYIDNKSTSAKVFYEEIDKHIKKKETMKYRKRPVVIDAIEWKGFLPEVLEKFSDMQYRLQGDILYINTLEGSMATPIGHMIIRGVAGEYYSCEPNIFEQTYEKA